MAASTYRNQSIDLQGKSIGWFLYDRELPHKRDLHIALKFLHSKSIGLIN